MFSQREREEIHSSSEFTKLKLLRISKKKKRQTGWGVVARRRWGRQGSSSGGGTSGGSIRCWRISSATPLPASASLWWPSASTSSASKSTTASFLLLLLPHLTLILTLIPPLPPLLLTELHFAGQQRSNHLFLSIFFIIFDYGFRLLLREFQPKMNNQAIISIF